MAVRKHAERGRIVVENDEHRDIKVRVIVRNANVTGVRIRWALPPSVKSAAPCNAAQQ
jgi:hypothetical protein